MAEIRNPTNLEAARLVGAARTVLLDIRETVAKLVVQTSRQSGAAAVYTELFDYDGDEIYFLEQHALGGATYGEALLAFEEASVIGLIDDGVPTLNPPPGHRDRQPHPDRGRRGRLGPRRPEPPRRDPPDLDPLGTEVAARRTTDAGVLIGWNDRAPIVLRELDKYAPAGSTLTVLSSFGDAVLPELTNLAVTVVAASTTDRATLEAHVAPDLDQVIVLCYSDHLEAQAADARTLVTLLHVRDILSARTRHPGGQRDDRRPQPGARAGRPRRRRRGQRRDRQPPGHPALRGPPARARLRALLGDEGNEIYLQPAEWYAQAGAEVSYATVVAGAAAPRRDGDRLQVRRARRRRRLGVRGPGQPRQVAPAHRAARRPGRRAGRVLTGGR